VWRSDPVEHNDEERHDGDDQCDEAGCQSLLCPDDGAVAAQEEEAASDDAGHELFACGQRIAVLSCPGEQNCAGNEEADGAEQERLEPFERKVDEEVSRAPNEIDSREGGDQFGTGDGAILARQCCDARAEL
jgi:hypothetical protein